MYHRVADVDSDPWLLCVTSQHFAEHLEVLRKHGYPVQVQQLNQALQDGKRLLKSIAITFDDGYADNFHNAKPLLERYDIPATVFVVSGHVGQEREFWWDELERLFLQPGTLPKTLQLSINGSPYQWELGEAVNYSEDTYQRYRRWHAEQRDDPSPRHSLYRLLYKLLQPLLEGERHKVLQELLAWSGAAPVSRPTHRSLSVTELLTLGQGKLIEVGSHTVTHPLLSSLPLLLQQDEIRLSKARLEEIVDLPVCSFAYPYGNYTAATVDIVRDAGFFCACSAIEDTVQRYSDSFQLPRFEVQNWNGEEFEKRLLKWLHV